MPERQLCVLLAQARDAASQVAQAEGSAHPFGKPTAAGG